jgi:hypothetical protein
MKRIRVVFSTIFVVISLVQFCTAQEQKRTILGLGMSIEPALFGASMYYYTGSSGPEGFYVLDQSAYATSPINLYLTINATPSFRIEPIFGIYSFRSERTTTTPGFTPPTSTSKTGVTLTHLGVGGFYLIPTSNSLQMYVGPRIGFNFVTTLSTSYLYFNGVQQQQEVETKETDFFVGLNFGAEYFPITEFSIGAEVSGNYVSFGNPEVTRTPASSSSSTTERKQHIITTNGLFFLRWYFVKSTDQQ